MLLRSVKEHMMKLELLREVVSWTPRDEDPDFALQDADGTRYLISGIVRVSPEVVTLAIHEAPDWWGNR